MLALEIRRPTADQPPTAPFVLGVLCEHGSSTSFWSRLCMNGCHLDPVRRLQCERLNPTDLTLRRAAVQRHGRTYQCECEVPFWLAEGPQHRVRPHVPRGATAGPTYDQVEGRATDLDWRHLVAVTAPAPRTSGRG